jgi:hypothetical protein
VISQENNTSMADGEVVDLAHEDDTLPIDYRSKGKVRALLV